MAFSVKHFFISVAISTQVFSAPLRSKRQPTKQSLKLDQTISFQVNLIIKKLHRTMAYVATASDPPIGGFTRPLKLPVTKEKNRFV